MCVAAPSGIAAPQNFHERRTPCGEFLAGRLCLARIESIWANVDELNDEDPKVREEAFKFIARLYVLPEHTHTGRQRHHIRREVFLTNTKEEENCTAILMRAKFSSLPRSAPLAATTTSTCVSIHTTKTFPLSAENRMGRL